MQSMDGLQQEDSAVKKEDKMETYPNFKAPSFRSQLHFELIS